jgi:hypothetical protein
MVRCWINKTLKIPLVKKAPLRALPSSAAGLFIKLMMKTIILPTSVAAVIAAKL